MRGRGRRLTAEDHHAQDALEVLAAGHLQYLAERARLSHCSDSRGIGARCDAMLARNGHSLGTLLASPRAREYYRNVIDAGADLFPRLVSRYPGCTFAFRPVGKEGRLERVKGDIALEIRDAKDGSLTTLSLSHKNYENGVQRIQVGSGTFQSFALGLIVMSVSPGTWYDPIDGSRMSSRSKEFRDWRARALARRGLPRLQDEFEALDELQAEMRASLLSDAFSMYDVTAVKAEQRRVGIVGARIIHRILSCLPQDELRLRVLKQIGFDGSEDLLVIGKGQIADTVTDEAFGRLVRRLRASRLAHSVRGQSVLLVFCDDDGVVLSIDIPCTVNTNGAWYRDGEPYEGTRFHPKEKCQLAWGQRRPKKSREIATSTNTYVDLASTGLLRSLPRVPAEDAA